MFSPNNVSSPDKRGNRYKLVQYEVVDFGHKALRVIRHPKCEKNDDENANGGTYKSEFSAIALA